VSTPVCIGIGERSFHLKLFRNYIYSDIISVIVKQMVNKDELSVRGFRESLLSYVKNGCPPLYVLELENVVFT